MDDYPGPLRVHGPRHQLSNGFGDFRLRVPDLMRLVEDDTPEFIQQTGEILLGSVQYIAGIVVIWHFIVVIGRLDPATGKIDEFPTPGTDIPRRMGADWDGNIWVGFHNSGKLVKIDHKTREMKYYEPPTKNSGTYHTVADARTKKIWVTLQTADKIASFDPTTETWTEFSLPIIESDARRIDIDPSNPNRIWWSGDTSSHLGYIELLP